MSRWGADGLVWLAVCVTVFLDGAESYRFGLSPVAADAIAVAVLTVAVAISRRFPVAAAALPTALSFVIHPDLSYENLLLPQLVLAFLLGRRTARLSTGLWLLAGICVGAFITAALAPDTSWVSAQRAVPAAGLAVLLPWLVGRYLRQRDELIRTGWELADRMERERDLADERARLRERSRIASDIHDSVGHELSLIALRAAAIEVDSAAGGAARRAAAELRGAAAQATTRLHDVIGVLARMLTPSRCFPRTTLSPRSSSGPRLRACRSRSPAPFRPCRRRRPGRPTAWCRRHSRMPRGTRQVQQ